MSQMMIKISIRSIASILIVLWIPEGCRTAEIYHIFKLSYSLVIYLKLTNYLGVMFDGDWLPQRDLLLEIRAEKYRKSESFKLTNSFPLIKKMAFCHIIYIITAY